ncbi:MAG: hypothetical protein JF607_27910, partial [Burkholderiales bacterium]|nr:hypothetical protein [Burkholderiales bacterium]
GQRPRPTRDDGPARPAQAATASAAGSAAAHGAEHAGSGAVTHRAARVHNRDRARRQPHPDRSATRHRPRRATAHHAAADRIADATGGAGAWVEEQTSDNRSQSVGALGEYRSVMRRGDTCVEIFRSRIADTDAFNGNVAPRAGKMMGKPYKCK